MSSYAFPKDAKDGDVVTLENGVAYQFDEAKDRWLVKDVAGSSYGTDADGNIGTPLYMVEMLAGRSTTETRKQASVLRKLCKVTGESIKDTPDTWELD